MVIPEVVTVSDARNHLSRLLAALSKAGSSASPVLIGPHRKPQGVLLSVPAYEALLDLQNRGMAVASASGSLAAEGLRMSSEAERQTDEYVQGNISAEQLVAQTIARYTSNGKRPIS